MGSVKCTCCMLRSKVTSKSMMQTERTPQICCTFDCGLVFACDMFRDLFTVANVFPTLISNPYLITQPHMELWSLSKARVCSTHILGSYCLRLVSLSRSLVNESYFWNLTTANFLSWPLVFTASASGRHDYHFRKPAILEKAPLALERKIYSPLCHEAIEQMYKIYEVINK